MSLDEAIRKTFDELNEINGQAGIIVLQKKANGEIIIPDPFYNTDSMVWASMSKGKLNYSKY